MQRLSHHRWGLLRVGSEWLMPALRESYEDTLNAAEGADLLIGMHAAYATRLVAEKTGIPWVSAVHIPMGFFSAFDPPILDFAPDVSRWLRCLGSGFWQSVFWISKRLSRPMARPWYQLRKKIGLSPTAEGNPLSDSHSPQLVLALFSKAIADKQPDWPQQTNITGFPFFDADEKDLPDSINEFLDAGPPPIVFTLGSAVSMNPGLFYETSAKCSVLLGHRAILVTGKSNLPQQPLPASVIAVEYAPFSTLFPRAAAIVHHGGIGTTAMAMRAGRPMLIVPNSWDQPDNGHRAVRLGIARMLSKRQFTPNRAAVELRQLLLNRAIVLAETGERDKAISDLTQSIRLNANDSLTYLTRGNLWEQKSEHERAIADYAAAIRLDPNYVLAYYNRAIAWAETGEHDKAIEDLTQAIRLDPADAEAYYRRGVLWERKGKYPKAISDYTNSIQVNPQFLESLHQLAWIQATCPDAGFRNGKQAVLYATKACEQTEWKDASFLDTLAAAYAEAGDFDKAVEWQTKAMNLVPEEEKADRRTRLELYESGKPYRED